MIDLRERVAVVTGASSGIGRRVSLDLAARGATVCGVARDPARLNALLTELHALSPRSWVLPLDVGDAPMVAAAFDEIRSRAGRIDVLVNNAAIEERRSVMRTSPDDVERTMRVNFLGVVNCTLGALPVMRERRFGRIVNVASAAGRTPIPGTAAYCASKAAVIAFSEAISYELEPVGIRVQVLFPGYVPGTPLASGAVAAGMSVPPRAVHRTEGQVSSVLLAALSDDRFEINVARLETVAPIVRAVWPRAYRRGVVRSQPPPAG